MSGAGSNAYLRRIGVAALTGLSDAEIAADPAGAMLLAQSVMRAALKVSAAFKRVRP